MIFRKIILILMLIIFSFMLLISIIDRTLMTFIFYLLVILGIIFLLRMDNPR